MKRLLLFFIFSLMFIFVDAQNKGVGIGTVTPHSSAAIEIADTSRGILIPRMTMNQRAAIQNPAEGLMVYQTDGATGFWYWDGVEWLNIYGLNRSSNSGSDSKTLIFTTIGF